MYTILVKRITFRADEKMIEQAHKVTLTSRAFRNDQLPMLCQELHDLTGFEGA